MTNAYRKGYRGEHEIEAIFREHGMNVDRIPNSGGLKWKGDVRGIQGFHIEIKRQERLQIPAWLRQARNEAEEGDTPALIFRQNRSEWNVCIPLSAFIDLIREARLWQ